MIKWWISVVLLSGFLVSCGGGPKPQTLEEGPWEVSVVAGGDSTSVPLAEEEVAVSEPAPEAVPSDVVNTPGEVTGSKPLPPREQLGDGIETPAREYTFGYRIQVLAASSMVLAEQEANRADSLLTLATYIEYEPPFYKVRVGDFIFKEDAKAALDQQVKGVFDSAWVVETMVRRPQ